MTGSPTVRQRELGKRLRELRNQHGLSVEDVAEKLLCSATKIRRLETGARRANLRDVRDLCGLYDAAESTAAELMDLARGAHEQVWWTGIHAAQDSNFVLLEFDEKPGLSPVVFIEGLTGNQYLQREADVARYREAIRYLRDSALSQPESVQRVIELRESYVKPRLSS